MQSIIIGASGLIGRYLYTFLGDQNWEVTGTAHTLDSPGLVSYDLAKDEPERLIQSLPADSIAFLLAGITNIDECKRNPEWSRAVNVEGTCKLIKALRKAGIKTVFASSDYVFSGNKGEYTETDGVDPVTVYGRQKVEVEQFILHEVPGCLIVRLSKVFTDDLTDNTLFADWYRKLKNRETIRCADDQHFCPTFIHDVVGGIKALADINAAGIYHVCQPEKYNREQLVRLFAESLRIPDVLIETCPSSEIGFLDERSRDTSMQPAKFLAATNFSFTTLNDFFARIKQSIELSS